MEYRPLDLTIISAEGLKDVNMFSKMDVYVKVSILGLPKNEKRTHVDRNGGTNPRWNHRVKFTIDEAFLSNPGLSLLFLLKSDRTFGNDKDIGQVNIPIQELLSGARDNESQENVVDYQVKTSNGKPRGTLKFSYKLGEKFTQHVEAKQVVDEPVTAYPAAPAPQAGSGYAYPPYGYGMPPPGMGAPAYHHQAPAGYGGYPPPGPHGYTPAPGYGYPPHPGYGYAPQPMQQVQKPKKNKGKMGGLGLGLAGGLLGGMLMGEMISDVGESAAYADGYEDAVDDSYGFDF